MFYFHSLDDSTTTRKLRYPLRDLHDTCLGSGNSAVARGQG